MEAIGTLAGGIAHDFNNILAGILGSIELAEHELPPGDSVRVQLDRARRASLRARDLVAKILTFSRRGEQQRAVQLLGPAVREAAGLLRASLPATIEIRTFICAEPVPVLCDIGQIHQVVMNLSANAAYAMQQRGGVLTISLETLVAEGAFLNAYPSFPPGPAACLSIADTGTGMDAATRERIFEPFFTTKPIGEGTGLGLAVAHGIVQDHGGVITLESELNVGTKFRIFLPLSEAPARGSASPFAPKRGAGQRILIVDDEADVVAIASSALTHLGYRPTAFTRAADALAAFRTAPQEFDAVVTDLMMPEIPGVDVVAAVRAERPDLPVLVLSGFMREAELERMHKLGITHFLEKPFPFASLAGAMRELFGQQH
jgi:CheY-like chemotaxis protein